MVHEGGGPGVEFRDRRDYHLVEVGQEGEGLVLGKFLEHNHTKIEFCIHLYRGMRPASWLMFPVPVEDFHQEVDQEDCEK